MGTALELQPRVAQWGLLLAGIASLVLLVLLRVVVV